MTFDKNFKLLFLRSCPNAPGGTEKEALGRHRGSCLSLTLLSPALCQLSAIPSKWG